MTKFNLSDKIKNMYDAKNEKGPYWRDQQVISKKHVKEFIDLLKEYLTNANGDMSVLESEVKKEIDKLAGEKLK